MALTPTVLQDAIIKLSSDNTFLDFERRQAQFSAFQMFKDGAPLLLPKGQVEQLKKSAAQVEKIAVLNRYTATTHSSYTCNFSPDGSTSNFVPITYSTIGFDVSTTPAVNAGNYITEAEDLQNQMVNGFRTVYESLEGTSVAYLETNKSNVNLSPLYGGPTAGVVTLTAAQQNDVQANLYSSIPAIFRRNSLAGKPQDLANTEAIIRESFLDNQGTANAQNSQYQTANINYYRSNYVTNATGMYETHYLTPLGAVGVYNWLPFEAQAKKSIGTQAGWDVMVDPIMGMQWQVYWKEDCVNGQYTYSASITASFGFVRQYSSVNGTTPILKYQVANPV